MHRAVFLSSSCSVLLPAASWISLPGHECCSWSPTYLSSWHTVMARLRLPSSTVCPQVAWLIGQGRRRTGNVYAIYPPFDESSAYVFLTPHLTLSMSDPPPCSGTIRWTVPQPACDTSPVHISSAQLLQIAYLYPLLSCIHVAF